MPTCSRHWEVEAVRDGRLGGTEKASFLRHATSCPACAAQVAWLDGFHSSLRALPAPPRDVLTARRSRRLILQRLDEEQLRPERRPVVARMAWAAVLVALVMGPGLWGRSSRAPVPAPAAQGLSVEVVPRGQAVWSERHAGSRREVVLASGEVLVKVAHKSRLDELVVLTPDAEIEDIGTIFSVRVEGGATREVHVVEGAVSIRRHGGSPLVVTAGGHWVGPVVSPVASAMPERAPSVASSSPVIAAEGARGRQRAPGPPAASRDDGRGAEFEQAMRLFRAGHLPAASADFDTFVLRHPGDARAEDAAYLSVVALARSGQRSAARRAASVYLTRYPNGLRARDVERLVR